MKMIKHQQQGESGGERPLPVQPAVSRCQGGVLGTRKLYIRASVEFDEYGTSPECQGCDANLTRSTAKNHTTEWRERTTTENAA